jgi:hypothetical protein
VVVCKTVVGAHEDKGHYATPDGRTYVVQRYELNDTISNGAYEEYRYNALGRRVLLRTRKTTAPPPGTMLAALCTIGPCVSSITGWIWDGARLLGEIRAPGQDGLNSGQLDQLFGNPPNYGTVGYVHHHAGGWDEPRALMDGRVLNPNWRGLPESSQLVDGTSASADCSMGLKEVASRWSGPRTWDRISGARFRQRKASSRRPG